MHSESVTRVSNAVKPFLASLSHRGYTMRANKGMELSFISTEMCMVLKLVQKQFWNQLYAIWIVHGEEHCNHLPIIVKLCME